MGKTSNSVDIQIKADVQGKESVSALTQRLDEMAKVLEGDLKQQAQQAAQRLRELAQQDAAIAAFKDLKREATAGAAALKQAEKEAADYTAQISKAGPPTAQEADALKKLQAAAEAARVTLTGQNTALAAATSELQRHGIAANSTQAAQQRLAREVQQVRDNVKDLAPAYQSTAQRAAAAGETMTRTHRAIGDGVSSISQQLQTVQNAYLALQGGGVLSGMIKDVAQTADAYNSLAAKIRLATGDGKSFEDAMAGVQQVAVATRSDLEATGLLFTKLLEAGKAQGMSQQQALALTQTINQAIQITGGSAEAAKAAITQLVQGLQSGVLRGDEFNSVMEQSPRLAQAMADGLNVTKGQLREMAEQGQLSAESVMRALRLQSETIETEFAKIPPTISGALQNLSSAWLVYIGNADKASGASRAAAEAINFLSQNLGTIAGYLIDAGQAAAAFAALRLAQTFLGISTAAKAAAVDIAATSTALRTTEVASGAAAVGVSRFASLLAGLRTFTLLGIITNFKDIGTWIGESAAKLAGYRDRTAELAREEAVQARILADRLSQRQRELDLQKQQIERQFGIDAAASKAIAKFDEMRKNGDLAADAIAKIGKDFDLSSQPGIRSATAVLDKLLADGKLTAEEFQRAWAQALDGKDLLKFETTARAALQGTAREAEQTAQIVEGSLRAALIRTGLDFEIISGGMSKASVSALNDVETIVKGFHRLKEQGIDAATALTASLGRAINTADSQKALDAVRDRIEALRKQLGDKIADGLLDQAAAKAVDLRNKLDDIKPGINSIDEAMRKLGLQTSASLQMAAADAVKAFDVIKQAGQQEGESYVAWQSRKTEAARVMLQRMIDANGGVATEAIKARAAMEGLSLTADDSGRAIISSMDKAAASTAGLGSAARSASSDYERLAGAASRAASAVKAGAAGIDGSGMDAFTKGLKKTESGVGAPVDASYVFTLRDRLNRGETFSAEELPAIQNALRVAKDNARLGNAGSVSLEGRQNDVVWVNVLTRIVEQIESSKSSIRSKNEGVGIPSSALSAGARTVNINMNGRSTSLNMASEADASRLEALLQEIAAAAGRST